jgi:hypothetical protein
MSQPKVLTESAAELSGPASFLDFVPDTSQACHNWEFQRLTLDGTVGLVAIVKI